MRYVMAIVAATAFVFAALDPVQGQTAPVAHSSELVAELSGLLTARGLDAIAAPDPAASDRFVAALDLSPVATAGGRSHLPGAATATPANCRCEVSRRIFGAAAIRKRRRQAVLP